MTSMGALQIISTDVRIGILHVVGFAVLSGLLALGAAFVYRERTTREIPLGTGVLIGVSLVAIWLNARAILSGSFVGDLAMTDYGTGYYLLGVVVAAVALAEGGRRVGDYLASDVFNIERIDSDSAIASLLKSAGVVVTIELPEEIADLDGYPPVDDAIKRRLAGRTFQFPHRLPEALLVARIEGRIESDFDVGQANVELDPDGTVERLAVGRQTSGVGPTLPPKKVAVGVRADAGPGASMGDPVELWAKAEEGSRLVAQATVRSTDADVTTVVIDESDWADLDPDAGYRLTTRPEAPSDVDEFISLLRTSRKTITGIEVTAGGPFEGEFVSWLPLTVLVIGRDEETKPFPEKKETLQAGDVVYGIGTADDLRQLAAYRDERLGQRTDGSEAGAQLVSH